MAFFKRASDGSVRFNGGKYDDRTVDDVAMLDPKYLRWARRDMTVGVPDDIFAEIDKAMISHGVTFQPPRRKS